jgi:hypothetical protein
MRFLDILFLATAGLVAASPYSHGGIVGARVKTYDIGGDIC